MSLKWKIAIVMVAGFAVLFLYQWAVGGCHVQRVVTPVYQYADQVVLKQVYSPYYYSVGQELQLDAIAERLAQRLELKLQQRAALNAPKSVLSVSCAKCHSPGSKAVEQSDAPIFFDDAGKLIASREQRASMRTAAKLGSMPPPPANALGDDDYLSLKRELETESVIVPPAPQPER